MDRIDQLLARDAELWQHGQDNPHLFRTATAPSHGAPRRPGNGVVRRWRLPVFAAVALTVLTSAVVLSIQHLKLTSSGPATTQVTIPVEQAPAIAEITRLISWSPKLANVKELATDPSRSLVQAKANPTQPTLVSKARWWSADATVSSAIAQVCATVPLELIPGHPVARSPKLTCTTEAGTPGALVISEPDTTTYVEAELDVTVVAYGNGVALMVQGQAQWLPPRTAVEQVPLSISAIDVTLNRGAPAVASAHRVLTGPAASRLAALVDALPVQLLNNDSCQLNAGQTDVLRLRTAAGDIVITANVSGCTYVAVTVDGAQQPGLSGGNLIDQEVSAALKLTPLSSAQPYPTNSSGEAYGGDRPNLEPATEPQLVLAIGTNGQPGYVTGYLRKADLEQPAPKSPAEAVAQSKAAQGRTRVIPLYQKDGRTVIGVFVQAAPRVRQVN